MPLWPGVTGGSAPSALDMPTQQDVEVSHYYHSQLEIPPHEREVPLYQSNTAPLSGTGTINEPQQQLLEDTMSYVAYAEEQRLKAKSRGKGRTRPTHARDRLPSMSPQAEAMQEELRARQASGIEYHGDERTCSICLDEFEHIELSFVLSVGICSMSSAPITMLGHCTDLKRQHVAPTAKDRQSFQPGFGTSNRRTQGRNLRVCTPQAATLQPSSIRFRCNPQMFSSPKGITMLRLHSHRVDHAF